MFTQTQDGSERLTAWRNFRQSGEKTEQEIVQAITHTKLDSRYLDYYTPESWPGVFELIQAEYMCQSSLTLIIASTMIYFNIIKTEEIRLDAISNHITGQDGLVLIYDNKCYNFLSGETVTLDYLQENSTCYESHIITTDKLFA